MKYIKVAAIFCVGVFSGCAIGVLVGYDLELGVYSPSKLESMISSGDFKVGSRIDSLPKVKPKLIRSSAEAGGDVERKRLFYDSDSAVIIISKQGIVIEIIQFKN